MPAKGTPLLPGFPCRFGRPRRSALKRVRAAVAGRDCLRLGELRTLFSPWIDSSVLRDAAVRAGRRDRAFSLDVVFWGFLCQVLSGLGCSGTVKVVQGWLVSRGRKPPSSNTSAYCQARSKLPIGVLRRILQGTASRAVGSVPASSLWHGRRLKVVDGTGLSAPDTAANQARWPQHGNAAPGCGFPSIRLVGLFCLHTGALLGWREGSKHRSEMELWRSMWNLLSPGDVVLGDRAFGSYACIATLLRKGVDVVFPLHQSRKADWHAGERLGTKDRLQTWIRGQYPGTIWTPEQWAALPDRLQIRLLQNTIRVPGFRPKQLTLVTTLTDPVRHPADELVGLYRRRWAVELYLRDIKTSLGMDELTCRTPEMVRKELLMHLICYNLLRGLMQFAAQRAGTAPDRISFKGAAQQLGHWLWLLMDPARTHAERRERLGRFLAALTDSTVPHRPDRVEPRVVKRRGKRFTRMAKPRSAYRLQRVAEHDAPKITSEALT